MHQLIVLWLFAFYSCDRKNLVWDCSMIKRKWSCLTIDYPCVLVSIRFTGDTWWLPDGYTCFNFSYKSSSCRLDGNRKLKCGIKIHLCTRKLRLTRVVTNWGVPKVHFLIFVLFLWMLWILESKDLQSEVVVDVPCQRSGTCMSVVILQVILSNCIYLFCPILEILSFLIIFLLDSFSSFYRQCNHKIKKTSIQNVWLGLDSWETFCSRLVAYIK